MGNPVLQLGATGEAVLQLQDLLNRGGAILDEDGQFGQGTENAVREAQAQGLLPATGVVDDATWAMLQALPEPSPAICTQAVAFIGLQEVGSRPNYDQVVCHPCYPGGDSGVTIGIGYDLGQEATFVTDWSPLLPPSVMAALTPWVGKQGTAAAAQALRLIDIPWSAAWQVFVQNSLPNYVTQTSNAFPGFANLPPLCRGMLVSLVYNRGPAMPQPPVPYNPSDRRLEMGQIRDAIGADNLAAVPGFLRAMKRLWPAGSGLCARRDQEAALFESGLTGN